ncbi:hypothetical protein [Bradyrhizobium sp. CCBAU 45384]|uniref:hypothetical protein n=1 Tax=Bradyrhizobium sp. CCBAU 45384 TaxID=858428 RepID=UPI002FE05664
MPCDFSYSPTRRERAPRPLQAYRSTQMTVTDAGATATTISVSGERIIGGRPAGCPSSFCGCGAALRVFGHVVPELNLASNWLRFPRAAPAPGMVAARRGHVFVLEQSLGGDMWMAYDANSGGHATRMHARSLRGTPSSTRTAEETARCSAHHTRSTLPGFMMFCGSSARLMVRMMSSSVFER